MRLVRLGIQVLLAHEDDLRSIERRAELAELRGALGQGLGRLSSEQRRALELLLVQERPYEEVEREMGISEPAARARVSRGLRSLGHALDILPAAQGGS